MRTKAARTVTANMLRASGAVVQVRVWIEDGETRIEGLTPFGYEPISRDEAINWFGLMQTQGLIRYAEKYGEWVA